MTTEAVASAKLSERLFNELHFSHIPALFDAKYLAGGLGVSSKM